LEKTLIVLNPPARIAFSKVPDSFYTSKLIALKFLVIKKMGFILVEQAVMLVRDFEKVVYCSLF